MRNLLVVLHKFTEILYPNVCSVQEVVDCSSPPNKGCTGGSLGFSFQYMQKSGLVPNQFYPYTAKVRTSFLINVSSIVLFKWHMESSRLAIAIGVMHNSSGNQLSSPRGSSMFRAMKISWQLLLPEVHSLWLSKPVAPHLPTTRNLFLSICEVVQLLRSTTFSCLQERNLQRCRVLQQRASGSRCLARRNGNGQRGEQVLAHQELLGSGLGGTRIHKDC